MKKVVLSILCLVAFSQANADVKLDFPFQKKFEVYEISGNSVEEIERSFNARPEFLVNEGFDGGDTAWKYDFHTNDDSCEFMNLSLKLPTHFRSSKCLRLQLSQLRSFAHILRSSIDMSRFIARLQLSRCTKCI